MRKNILLLMFFMISILFAENSMELIWEQQGEFIDSDYGRSVVTIDFNGDNIDDLVVSSTFWNSENDPSESHTGKIYFYWGGNDFDAIPDLTIDGDQFDDIAGIVPTANLGDINGDGFDDLGIIKKGIWQNGVRNILEIYYGGTEFDANPDVQHTFLTEEIQYITSYYPLGDINNDGFDDAGFATMTSNDNGVNQFYIIYGGTEPQIEYWNTIGSGGMSIRGIGNINSDNFDDFMFSFKDIENELKHNVIVYGDSIIDTVLTDTLYSQTSTTFDSGGSAVGDVNNDGYDDFIGCWGFYSIGTFLWLGGDELNPVNDITLECITNGNKCVGYGDLNNDGFSDIVLGHPGWSLDQGKAYFFIGDEHPNGTVDLEIEAPVVIETEFGTSVAVGDFNNDGFDDAAIGAPIDGGYSYRGGVYVYAGNADLAEITPYSTDENELPYPNNIEFRAYPNPFTTSKTTRSSSINFEIISKDQQYDKLHIEVYNAKGQKIETIAVILNGDKGISTHWSTKGQPSGVYLCKLVNDNQELLSSQKITIIK